MDSVELGIPPQDIPNINVMIRKVEESTDSSTPLNQGETKDLAETLDKVSLSLSHEADVPISFVHVCSDCANAVSGRVYLSSLVIGSRCASHF